MEIAGKEALLREINHSLTVALGRLVADDILPASEFPPFTSSPCRDPSRGDYTSNCAMVVSAAVSIGADVIAQETVSRISFDESCFCRCESCGGYINFTLSPRWYSSVVDAIVKQERVTVPSPTKDIPQGSSPFRSKAADESYFDVVSLPQRTKALLDSLSDYGMANASVPHELSLSLAMLLSATEEKRLIKHLALYNEIAKSASYTTLMSYCGRLSMLYGEFAAACPIRNTHGEIMKARATLCAAVYKVSSALTAALNLDTTHNERLTIKSQ